MLDLIALGLAAWLGTADVPAKILTAVRPAVSFNPHQRAVSNWRLEAATHLDPPLALALALVLGREPQQVTRCVRLNNYWCIKRAGWAGEIAADAEGHVAFASALEGADVAALLLRRYYVGYGRRSARAIVSHWAPATCGLAAPATPPAMAGPRLLRAMAGPRLLRAMADRLTVHGLGHTLRARFLVAGSHRVAARMRLRGRPSIIPDRLIGSRTVTPSIAWGLPTAPLDVDMPLLAPLRVGTLGAYPPGRITTPELGCAGDDARIEAYAAKAAAGVAPSVDADLKLFDGGGSPTANLARVMENMSSVEIGPLGAGKALITAAVDHVRLVAASPASPPPVANLRGSL